MDLKTAQLKFIELLGEVNSTSRSDFLKWIQHSDQFESISEEEIILKSIVNDMHDMVPFQAILPSEKINIPHIGKNADCQEDVMLHVDSFLFSDDYLDELVDAGKFSRNFCNSCGSKDTTPLTFISHSASIPTLQFLFKKALPDLTGKHVIDVGSRLGPFLYGAFLFTSCEKIVGIEINADFCNIQKKIITKYGMSEKISVVNEDVINCRNILLSGDVIIMNNVFEFFADLDRVKILWKFIIDAVKGSNKLLVTVPSLQESLEPLGLLPLLRGFAQEVCLNFDACDDIEDVHLYKISSKES